MRSGTQHGDIFTVYVARNVKNGWRYVGVTTLTMERRRGVHLSEARRERYSHPFHSALREGVDDFEWVVASQHFSEEGATLAEGSLIAQLRPEYNSGRAGAGRFGPSAASRPVVCLTDMDRLYESASSAARAYGLSASIVIEVCNRHPRRITAGGHIFRYINDNEGLDAARAAAARRRERAKRNQGNNIPRPVKCVSDGKIYSSAPEASRAYGIPASRISEVCKGTYKNTGGLVFEFCGPPAIPPLAEASGVLPACARLDPDETWRPLKGLERTYAISNKGRLCGLDRMAPHARSGGIKRKGALLKVGLDKDGYEFVSLRFALGGKSKRYKIHALVADTFHGPRPNGLLVLHRDGNRANNSADNLYYGTQKQNTEDARRHGTLPVGERQWNSKLTALQVREIRQIGASMKQRDIARLFNVGQATVQKVLAGETWVHLLSEGGGNGV